MKKTTHLIHIFILTMMMLALPNMQASAMLVHCRTDPIFTLSNGQKVVVVLDIDTDEASVLYINYILHVPAGVTLKTVVFTAGGMGQLETYWIIQDSPANTYTTESFLLAKQNGIAIVATTSLSNKITQSVSGYSGQNLIVTVSTITATSTSAKVSSK